MFRLLYEGKYHVSVTKQRDKDFWVNAVYDAGSGLFLPHYTAWAYSKPMTFLQVAGFISRSRGCFKDVNDCLGLIVEGDLYSFPEAIPVRTELSKVSKLYGLSYEPGPRNRNPYSRW